MLREQLSFELSPIDRYSLDYFVSHSGVEEAVRVIAEAVDAVLREPSAFRLVFFWGPPGSGKTHLVQAYSQLAEQLGIASDKILVVKLGSRESGHLSEQDDTKVSEFIYQYECVRAQGGLVFITGRRAPTEVVENPHLRSRLLAGSVVRLSYPREEELRPLLLSLLERRNMKLPDGCIEYLLRRLPIHPLSFDTIFARISDLSYSLSKPAKLGIVRKALQDS